jgi:hypothetical protein
MRAFDHYAAWKIQAAGIGNLAGKNPVKAPCDEKKSCDNAESNPP